MTLNLAGVVQKHKDIGKSIIYASEVTATIYTEPTTVTVSSGAPMFSNVGQEKTYQANGPFKCIWIDADAARVEAGFSSNSVLGRYERADTWAKFWLADLLVSGTDPYGETFFDRASHLVSGGKRYEILGYDRHGLGLTQPYMISVALTGSFTSNG